MLYGMTVITRLHQPTKPWRLLSRWEILNHYQPKQQLFRVSIVDLQMFPVLLCKVYPSLCPHLYHTLASANQALAAIEQMGNPQSLSAQKGEALICRAYNHFV